MINLDVMKRLIESERENNILRNEILNQQAKMEYLAMMTDIDISTSETGNQESTQEGEAK